MGPKDSEKGKMEKQSVIFVKTDCHYLIQRVTRIHNGIPNISSYLIIMSTEREKEKTYLFMYIFV